MDLRETHREVNRIRCKVEIDEVTIGRVRGALWQGKEVGSEEDMSISMVDAEIDGEVPSPQNSPRRFHLLFLVLSKAGRQIHTASSACSAHVSVRQMVPGGFGDDGLVGGTSGSWLTMTTHDGCAGYRPRRLKTRICRLRQGPPCLCILDGFRQKAADGFVQRLAGC